MRPRFLPTLAILSLLLFTILLVIWLRSFRIDEPVNFSYHHQAYRLLIHSGATIIDNQPEILAQTEREEKARRAIASVPGSMFLLFVPGGERVANPPSHIPLPWSKSSYIPIPTVAVFLAVIPVFVAARSRRRRTRLRRGLCPHCGYDLTANTTGVCPECGSAVTHSPHQS